MNYVWKWFVYSKKKTTKNFVYSSSVQTIEVSNGPGIWCCFWVMDSSSLLWLLSSLLSYWIVSFEWHHHVYSFILIIFEFCLLSADCLDYLFVCLIMNVSYYPPVLVHAQSFSKSRKVDSVSVWIAALYLFEFSLFWSFESATTKARLFLNILPPLSCIWVLICIIITKL